ncbi:MAG: competence ComEA-like helix-hairpin-helix protein [Saprospiraceae bacterium]|jgi:competence ComEA-like helix-hairpin-helix protein
MNRFLKDYFYYTKNEIRGVIVLSILLLIISIAPSFINFVPTNNDIDFLDFEAKAALIMAMNLDESTNYENKQTDFEENNIVAETFYFNPNTAKKSDFEHLGLSSKTAQSIINYRNKGGKFYKPEDFKKIYTLKAADYQRLLPFIQLEKRNQNNYKPEKEAQPNRIVEQFAFNPNTTNKADFERLGLTARTAQSIINYRNKGGKFYKPEDFKKIYTLNEVDYKRLESYINIPKKEKPGPNFTTAKGTENDGIMDFSTVPKTDYIKKSTTVEIDINTAKVEDFQQLKGIGAGYAKRIIKYRTQLGGFLNINQIQEVYGISKETFESIKPQLIQISKIIQKININTTDYETLITHPYIDSKRANAIIKYRKQHGNFKSIEDLKNIYAISAKTLERIKPYLKVGS